MLSDVQYLGKYCSPFRVRWDKIRAAFDWLKEHNVHYRNTAWNEENESAWETDAIPFREDDIEQKNPVSEDEAGYIAKAFLRVFGTGDYHELKSKHDARLTFATWGKYALQYHDSRAKKHPRFKYFIINSCMRMKTMISVPR